MKSMTLLLIASALSFTVHAETAPETNCAAKIQELEDIARTDGQALDGGMAKDYQNLLDQAKAAQAAGNMTECQASADRAKTIYNKARSK